MSRCAFITRAIIAPVPPSSLGLEKEPDGTGSLVMACLRDGFWLCVSSFMDPGSFRSASNGHIYVHGDVLLLNIRCRARRSQ